MLEKLTSFFSESNFDLVTALSLVKVTEKVNPDKWSSVRNSIFTLKFRNRFYII